jgi:hypothetical protein
MGAEILIDNDETHRLGKCTHDRSVGGKITSVKHCTTNSRLHTFPRALAPSTASNLAMYLPGED